MPHTDLWTFTNLPGTREALVGCDVEARDGSIGKVDEATPETGRANIVVDTGPWILGRKVVIPAGTIERIGVDDKKIFVGLTKDQIKDSPEYDGPVRGRLSDAARHVLRPPVEPPGRHGAERRWNLPPLPSVHSAIDRRPTALLRRSRVPQFDSPPQAVGSGRARRSPSRPSQ